MQVTTKDIRLAVRKLDLSSQALCIHASLRSFGPVEGGASTIIRGLREEDCTVLVPASAWSYFAIKPKPHQLLERNGGSPKAWQAYFDSQPDPLPGTKRIYSPNIKEIDKGMGAIPAAVVANPKRVRGDHPLFSFAALGPLAETLIRPQSPLNVFGPFKELVNHDGAIVLMGVGLTTATFLHFAEEVAGRVLFRRWANGKDGQPVEVAVGGCSDGFEKFSAHLADVETSYRVGDCTWRVYPARQLLARAVAIIQANPQITHCENEACERCQDAVLGGPILEKRPLNTTPDSPKFVQITQILAPQGKLRQTWPLKGGSSAEMAALEIETPEGQLTRMIVRQHRDGQRKSGQRKAEDEFKLLQTLKSLSIVTQGPYYLDLSGQIFAAPYIVIDYIDGQMDFAPTDLDHHIRQLASQLAQIHSINCSTLDLSFLPKRISEVSQIERTQAVQLDSSLEEGQIREALAPIGSLSPRNKTTLLHGDFWPGNTLWQDGQLVAVIDWEDAELGDPLIDLAISRLDIAWIFGLAAHDVFTQQYQSLMTLDYTHLPYWDLRAALRFIGWTQGNLTEVAAFFTSFGRPDIREQTIKDDYRYFVTQALKRLDV